MKRTSLNYRFHNSNSAEDTIDLICKVFIEANTGKVERAIEEAAMKYEGEGGYIEGVEKSTNIRSA